MVLSQLPEYTLSPTTVRHITSSVCPRKVVIHSCVPVSHTRMVLSPLPEYTLSPTTVRHITQLVCPRKVYSWIPDGVMRSLNCSFKKSALPSSIPNLRHTPTKQITKVYLVSISFFISSLFSTSPSLISSDSSSCLSGCLLPAAGGPPLNLYECVNV